MKRILRLTESELTNTIKRIVNEGVETTAMTPIVTKEIPLSGGRGLAIYSGKKTKEGRTIYQDITVRGNNTIDPSKRGGERSKDFVNVTFFVASNFYTSLTYDCVNKKVLRTGGKVSGQLSPGAQVELLGKKEGNSRTVKTFDNNGQAMYDLTNEFLTTTGPAAQVTQHYCSTK
jgi:hypothetical protein